MALKIGSVCSPEHAKRMKVGEIPRMVPRKTGLAEGEVDPDGGSGQSWMTEVPGVGQ